MRLFVAIELDDRIKQQLCAVKNNLSEFGRAVRWVRPEQMHLTLKFLGEVADDRVDAVCTAAAMASSRSEPFTIEGGGGGCFPPRGRVRVLHAHVSEGSGALQRCRDECEGAFAELGFPREERPFTPHLTLGRVREDRTNGRLRQAIDSTRIDAFSQRVTELFVVQSVLSPQGARYTNVARYELGVSG